MPISILPRYVLHVKYCIQSFLPGLHCSYDDSGLILEVCYNEKENENEKEKVIAKFATHLVDHPNYAMARDLNLSNNKILAKLSIKKHSVNVTGVSFDLTGPLACLSPFPV